MGNRSVPERERPLWAWLIPSVLLLGAMMVWGTVRYSDLPGQVPLHIGSDRVDAWTEKTVWSVFIPVFTYFGVSLVTVGCAAAMLRATPLDDMPQPRDRWVAAGTVMNNRPASAASARRTARALLIMNAWLGLLFVPMCWVQWRVPGSADVPAWLLPGTLVLFLLSFIPLAVAWRQDAAEKKAA